MKPGGFTDLVKVYTASSGTQYVLPADVFLTEDMTERLRVFIETLRGRRMNALHEEIARAEVAADTLLRDLVQLGQSFPDANVEEDKVIWRGIPQNLVRDLMTLSFLRSMARVQDRGEKP